MAPNKTITGTPFIWKNPSAPTFVFNSHGKSRDFRRQDLTRAEERYYEDSWDRRHHLLFSQFNSLWPSTFRDYFDRPRVAEPMDKAGPKVGDPLRQSWQLERSKSLPQSSQAVRNTSKTRDPCMRLDRDASEAAVKDWEKKRNSWDRSHHLTHSAGNQFRHKDDREFFGQYQCGEGVERNRSGRDKKRFLERQLRGFTMPYNPPDVNGALVYTVEEILGETTEQKASKASKEEQAAKAKAKTEAKAAKAKARERKSAKAREEEEEATAQPEA
eukprot:gnl/MRDRNA2_/MRDRNA2_96925_c0_seq1.p1 gnl/MRDRNA2_/MRDRNA2_96925_c0~~gnl/MRDRNA2_/MRDRNA2_96925_c0_seq1.p1  ORF type:complete len:272 (-),score=56.67 gnl/MRDRNA2_/MRDRNA2_96925_c0_seq1:23-838(-)